MASTIKVTGKKENGFLSLQIKNRYNGNMDNVFMDSEGALFHAVTFEEVCEQDYFLDCDKMSKIYSLNFN